MLYEPKEPTAVRILICEDEALVAEDIAQSLSDLGYEVVGRVSTGEEAVRAVEVIQPDIILMDIKLQGMLDGISACEQIRCRWDIPVVYLTAYAESDILERAKKTEPYGYLGKPVSMSELRSTVEIALYKHEADRRVRESEERYRRIFNNIQDIYCETLLDGTIVEISPSVERLSKYARDELIGASLLDFYSFPEQRQTMLKILLDVGSVSDYEAVYKDKDGTLFPVSASMTTVCDDNGKPCKFCGSFRIIADRKKAEEALKRARDELEQRVEERTAELVNTNEELKREIHERKLAEESLRDSEQTLSGILAACPIGLDLVREDRTIQWANEPWARMFGFTDEDDFMGENSRLLYPSQEEYQRVGLTLYNQLLTRTVAECDAKFKRRDGSLFDGTVRVTAVDRSDPSKGAIAAIADISERKRGEELLRNLLDFRQTLIDSIPNPVFYKDVEGRYLGCNDAFAALVGLPKEAVVGKSVYEVAPKELADIWSEKDMALFSDPHVQVFECTMPHPDGTERSMVVHEAPFGGPDGTLAGLIGVMVDVTDRLLAEQALRQSEERYRELVEQSFDGIWVQEGTRIVFANSRLCEMLGYRKEELLGLDHWLVYHPDYWDLTRRMAHARMQGEPVRSRYEVKLQRKDGTVLDGEISARAVKVNGEPGVQVWVRDITDRKRDERALIDSEERMRLLIEASPVGIGIVQDGKYAYVNPALIVTMGCTGPNEIVGVSPLAFIVPEDRKLVASRGKQRLEGLETLDNYQVGGVKKNGERYEVSIWPRRIDYSGKPALLSFVADVTEENKLKAQLLQAQKMEAIGTLAGGIAHDFNNLLTVVVGFTELLMAEKDQKHPDYDDLQKIFRAARNGADLVQRLLMFSRKSEPKPVPMNLNKRIVQVEKLLRRTIPKMVEIRLDLSSDLPKINADPSQIEQVLMNLAVNARDAMPDKGKLTVRTDFVTIDEDYCRLHVEVSPGEYVLLEVSDTGHGIDKEIVEHIFEPFFTTKEMGRGTGLGLAMVYGIVKQHNGHITVYSEVGKGTTFRVYLPAIPADVEPDVEDSGIVAALGTETVLLVDDEEFVRELGARILSKHGYTLLHADNGRKALDLFKRESSRISLVILDLIMPEMGGKECLKELLKLDPQVKVLVASGYSADASVKETIQLGAKGFVTKPFRVNELLRGVRRVLDEG